MLDRQLFLWPIWLCLISCDYVSNNTIFGKGGRETSGKKYVIDWCFVNMCTGIYCVFVLFRLCIFIFIYLYLLLV